MQKFFSAIVPTYSRPQLCLDAVKSVLLQSYTNFEIIIVGHGKENYISYLKENIKDENNLITYFYIGHKYISEARNFGAENSKGQWLAFLDDDDLWKEEKLAIFANVIKNGYNLDIVYSNFTTEYSHELLRQDSLTLYNKFHDDLYTALQYDNFVSGGSAAAIYKKSFIKIGKFDCELGACEDHDLWRRAVNSKLIFYYIDKPLTIYRKFGGNLGNNTVLMKKFSDKHKKKILSDLPVDFIYNQKRTQTYLESFMKNKIIFNPFLVNILRIIIVKFFPKYFQKINEIYKRNIEK
jgi:glycosyltransferase involved in cell wall biosynthesis